MTPIEHVARMAWSLSGMQTLRELAYMLDVAARLEPTTIVEIGTRNGATLWALAQVCPAAALVSVDPTNERRGLQQLVGGERELHLVTGRSQDPASVASVQAALAGRAIDFLFVDGGHEEWEAQADVDLYGPLVSPQGIVCLHDVALHRPELCVGVQAVWRRLSCLPGAFEYVDPAPGEVPLGYGFVPGSALAATAAALAR